MRNNIFSFAYTYWLQLTGTAMGTPAAWTYAILTFRHFENTVLLPLFNANLIYLLCKLNRPNARNDFKKQINNWGNLEWVVEEP